MPPVYRLAALLCSDSNKYEQGKTANALLVLSARMGSEEASRSAQALVDAIVREPGTDAATQLAEAIVAVTHWLDPAEATGICSEAARALASALEPETDAGNRQSLASGLASLSGRLDGTEAARISPTLVTALSREADDDARKELTIAFTKIVGQLGPSERREHIESAVHPLALAVENERSIESIAALTLTCPRFLVRGL